MNDLFEKLKAEPPVKIFKKATVMRKANDDIDESPLATPPPPRCLSTPPSSPSLLSTAIVKKKDVKSTKSENRSPQKRVNSSRVRSLKIRIKRNNLDEIISKVPSQKTASADAQKHRKRKALQDPSSSSEVKTRTPKKRTKSPVNEPEEDALLKTTTSPMTKAQQKLFESPQQKQLQPKLKRCEVRVRRENLLEVQQMPSKQTISEDTNLISSILKRECENSSGPATNTSAISNPTLIDTPLDQPTNSKRSRSASSSPSQKRSFFIKLPSSQIKKPESKGDARQNKSVERAKTTKNPPALKKHYETDQAAHCNLVNTFGKRFFAAYVHIQRSRQLSVLTIESNERARKRKTRQNKAKKLSVSFKETVEVLGNDEDDTDEDHQETEHHPIFLPGQIDLRELYLGYVRPPPQMGMENGNDIDDVVLDDSPTKSDESMPIEAASRKRSPRKSYSPLKDDTTPSPRRERLKLANEKVPPEGMLLINIDDDDDEFIVPDVIQWPPIEPDVEGDKSKQKKHGNANGTALDTSKIGSEESFGTELGIEASISAQVENGQESNSKNEETAISKRKVVVTTAIDVDDEMSTKANSDDESKTKVNDDHLSNIVEDNLSNKDLNESPKDAAEDATFKLPKKTAYKSPTKVNERESPHTDRGDAKTTEKVLLCFDVSDDETTTNDINGLTKISHDGGTGLEKGVVSSSPREIDDNETAPRDITSSPQEIKDDETTPGIVFLSPQEISDDDTAANYTCESVQVINDDNSAPRAVFSSPQIYDEAIAEENVFESPQKVSDNETGMKDIFESPKNVNYDEKVENKRVTDKLDSYNKALAEVAIRNVSSESAGNSSSSFVSAEEIQHLHDLLSADQDSRNPAVVSAQLSDDNQSVENLAVSVTNEFTNCALIGSENIEDTVHSNHRRSSIERELSLHLFVEDEENESVDEIVKDTINKLGQDIELEDDCGSRPHHVGDDDVDLPSTASNPSVVS